MSAYVIYNAATTITIKHKHGIGTQYFATLAAAKGAHTRLCNAGKIQRGEWLIASAEDFRSIEKSEECINLMSGKKFKQSVNTPLCCDPSSETYWSM